MRISTVRVLSVKIFCSSAGLLAAGLVDAVEAAGVSAGIIVEFQLVVAGDLELVGHGAHRHGFQDRLVGLQVLAGQFEGVVPGDELAGADLLALAPVEDAVFLDSACATLSQTTVGRNGKSG